MGRYVRFGLMGCGGLALLFFVLLVGIVIGGSGSDTADSAVENNEAEQDAASQEGPPEAAPAAEPLEFSGIGPQATETFELSAGLARFEMTHRGESNFIVYLLNEEGEEDLVLSEIGAVDASQAIQVPEDGTYLLNIEAADGPWTVTIR